MRLFGQLLVFSLLIWYFLLNYCKSKYKLREIYGTSGDSCSEPISTTLPYTYSASTVSQPTSGPLTCGNSEFTRPGVWFSVLGTGDRLLATTCGDTTDFNTVIYVFTDCTSATCYTYNDNWCGRQSAVSWLSDVGTQYSLFVTGNSATAVGTFALEIFVGTDFKYSFSLSVSKYDNENCTTAVEVPSLAGGVIYYTVGDTTLSVSSLDDCLDRSAAGS